MGPRPALREAGHRRTKIMMMSANIGESMPAPAETDDHDDALPKPFDLRRFLDRLRALLGLDWIYDEEGEPAAPARPGRAFAPASARQIEELRRLGEIGYVRGIEAKLDEIAGASGEVHPFIAELRGHVRNFDLRRYLAAVEASESDA
jgi:hypothetical protein